MEYGININFLKKNLEMEKAAEITAKAGFTMLDYTPPLREDNWKEQMQEHMKIFNAFGLTVHQTHAPFNRYRQYEKELFKTCTARCFEASELMGAEFVVVHGDEYDIENREFSVDAAMEYNHNIYLPYVEGAKKSGYKVAFETVFEDGQPYRRFTSKIDELEALIKSYNSPDVVCCWDFGHAYVSFWGNAAENIKRLGSLIQCTHLHDNAGNDSHQLPMTGDIDWNETMSALHKIDYRGVMSIEYAHGCLPEHIIGDFVNLSYKTAKHLWEMEIKD